MNISYTNLIFSFILVNTHIVKFIPEDICNFQLQIDLQKFIEEVSIETGIMFTYTGG